ncbi:MAG: hypothetical protein Ct9H300mP23_12390 [Nitrospinota bacterium]|nr:MAG: hypothetical protein Ct9H300mP23_12390 [Nitrospinota bacterium]
MIDQQDSRRKTILDCRTIEEVGHAIKTMVFVGPCNRRCAAKGPVWGRESIEASSLKIFITIRREM